MEIKHLWLRFVLLAALIVLAVVVLSVKGLQLGIDLRGGYSLVYDIQSYEDEIQAIRDDLAELEARLLDASEDEKPGLIDQIDARKSDIERLKETQKSVGNLSEQMIAVLRERVDPLGLLSLEWIPQSNNRIEIRMPIPSKEIKLASEAYQKTLDNLAERNIGRDDIRRLEAANPQQQEELIAAYAEGDAQTKQRLGALLAAHQSVVAARDALSSADPQGRQAAEDRLDDALIDYEAATKDIRAGNINRRRLETILANYVSPREELRLNKEAGGKKKVRSRRQQFEDDLSGLKGQFPARVGQIDSAVAAYQAWDDVRGPLSSADDLKRLLQKVGILEFRIAPFAPERGFEGSVTAVERQQYVDLLEDLGPEEILTRNMPYVWLPLHDAEDRQPSLVTSDYAGQPYVLLHNRPGKAMLHRRGKGGWKLKSAAPDIDPSTGLPAVRFTLDVGGATIMRDLTANHQTQHMAIVLDDEVYSAPRIKEDAVISDRGIITVGGDPQEVNELVKTLNAGSLPAKLSAKPVSENAFGPALGEIYIQQGFRAAIWSLVAVATFMLLYYLLAGGLANIALVLNLLLILGTMSMLDAAFTLEGIVGIILTVGIAVDANVLIFERLREEQAKDQPVGLTIKNAYQRAFSAIFDANLTTLITCLILGWIGTEEIRGFAIALGLGVVFSLFTAMVVTRWVFYALLKLKVVRGRIRMVSLIGTPSINWIRRRYVFWTVSIALVVIGIVSLVSQGSDVMGVQFSSGTKATIRLKSDATVLDKNDQPQLPNDALVRERFVRFAGELGPEGDLLVSTANVVRIDDPNVVDEFMEQYDANDDGVVTAAEWKAANGNETFFAKLDVDGTGSLTRAELADGRLPSRLYQVETTETDVEKIRSVAADAFQGALQRRAAVKSFDFVTDKAIEPLGLALPANGMARVTVDPRSLNRNLLEEYADGVALAVVDVDPPISEVDLKARIRETRETPSFVQLRGNRTEVLGLAAAEDGYTSLAVLVVPQDAERINTDSAWNAFAEDEKELLAASLEREEAMIAQNFDPAIAGEARGRAIMAIVLSCLAIVAYLWLRFGSVQWGLAAVLCLIHDVLIVVGLVAATAWLKDSMVGQWLGITEAFKIDLPMVAAFLTVIGYSVNDTIVVFDRIRENRGKLTTISPGILNRSINQTLARTLLTSGTTLIVVIIMYVWGGQGIHAFSYALLAGVLFGTYSSIAIASPLLLGFKKALVTKVAAADVE